MTTAEGSGAAGADREAPLDERANEALDTADGVLDMVGALHHRVVATEAILTQEMPSIDGRLEKLEAKRKGAPGERRSDYRFELYPAAADETELAHQVKHATDALARLAAWVDWLVATYRLTTVVPACWAEHATVFEELVGLLVAWVAAWSDAAGADAVVLWHERLSKAKARLSDGNWGKRQCSGEHDGTGLDLADHFNPWAQNPRKAAALTAAQHRAAATIRNTMTTKESEPA